MRKTTLLSSIFLSLCILSSSAFAANRPVVVLHTSMGDIKIALNSEKAPKSVDNFLAYAKAGNYDGTIFHRVISSFMIQGGGYTPDLKKKGTNAPIQNEADNGLKNKRGTIAMARTMDPHSATSQFFINVVDNNMLNYKTKKDGRTWGYAVFGEVIEGLEVVDDIRFVETAAKAPLPSDVPVESVVIKTVEILSE